MAKLWGVLKDMYISRQTQNPRHKTPRMATLAMEVLAESREEAQDLVYYDALKRVTESTKDDKISIITVAKYPKTMATLLWLGVQYSSSFFPCSDNTPDVTRGSNEDEHSPLGLPLLPSPPLWESLSRHILALIVKGSKTSVDPEGTLYYTWAMQRFIITFVFQGVTTVAVFYNFFTIILRVAFSEVRSEPLFCWILWPADMITDIMYLLDIAMQLRKAYRDDHGIIINDPRKMAVNYYSSTFFIADLLSIFPSETLGFLPFRAQLPPCAMDIKLNSFSNEWANNVMELQFGHDTVLRYGHGTALPHGIAARRRYGTVSRHSVTVWSRYGVAARCCGMVTVRHYGTAALRHGVTTRRYGTVLRHGVTVWSRYGVTVRRYGMVTVRRCGTVLRYGHGTALPHYGTAALRHGVTARRYDTALRYGHGMALRHGVTARRYDTALRHGVTVWSRYGVTARCYGMVTLRRYDMGALRHGVTAWRYVTRVWSRYFTALIVPPEPTSHSYENDSIARAMWPYFISFFPLGEHSPVFRISRLFKLHYVLGFFEVSDLRTSKPNRLRAFKLILYLGVAMHWVACAYYMISEYEGLGTNGWVYPEATGKDARLSRKYIKSLYWSILTLTTIGETPEPITNLEHVFTGFMFLLGIFVFAAVVGNVGDVISNMNAQRMDFQIKMDYIKWFMEHHDVPVSVQERTKRWAYYAWSRSHALHEGDAMALLPQRLRAEIAIHVHLATLKKVKIFKDCDEGREMFIINRGKVELYESLFLYQIIVPDATTGEQVVVARLSEGNYFGEISLLRLDGGRNRYVLGLFALTTEVKRSADVRSVGYSELLCLSQKDLMEALEEYPDAKTVLESQGRDRLQRTKSEALSIPSSVTTLDKGQEQRLNFVREIKEIRESMLDLRQAVDT
ncbi:hypothetical protein QZH41_017715, partial [Actinostola sp. cb2023]